MRNLKKYVQTHLQTELDIIRTSERANVLLELSLEEKAIVYKYTDDDMTFIGLNKELRKNKGQNPSEFAQYLDSALSKLKNYVGLVYRSTDLPEHIFDEYKSALINKTIITEYAFISTSQSEIVAKEGYPSDFLFEIFSKNGKAIEKISKFGLNSFDNEYEVLFTKGSRFKVLDITKFQYYTLITLKEV
jgi:ADP-ribosyltransferase exoenzyme